jgi:DNA mismatch repair protein MutS
VIATVPFTSILFDRPESGVDVDAREEPAFFGDLNLDQVVESILVGQEEYGLEPFFYAPLHDVGSVRFRHEVLRDLAQEQVLDCVEVFSEKMRAMREHLAQAKRLHYPLQKQRLFLDAVDAYEDAVSSFAEQLDTLELSSRGFQDLRAYLAEYTTSDVFTSLAAETRDLEGNLASVKYSVLIRGGRVKVGTFAGEANYSEEVEETFARFKQGDVKDYRVKLHDSLDMNHIEARILGLVAQRHPTVVQKLGAYVATHGDYLDQTVAAFDREVQFYVSYIRFIDRFRSAGLPFCYPHVSARSKEIHVEEAFDLALAGKLVPEKSAVVRNDLYLEGAERVFVVAGPNQGGKTTFARMVGQLHYLGSLGLLVPGKEARLFLPDRVFAHFERQEDIRTLRGKLEDELVRIHAILQEATDKSIIIMNESFSATTLQDSLTLGRDVMKQIIDLDSLCVYVTFVDELASLGATTVSMVSTVVPDDPAERTYKIVRRPADGLAYAAAIAEKHGLTYQSIRRRIAR